MNGRSLYPPLLLRGDEAVLIDYGTRGPSFEALEQEASPAQTLRLTTAEGNSLQATVEARSQLPAYTLEGYTLRWIVYIHGNATKNGATLLSALITCHSSMLLWVGEVVLAGPASAGHSPLLSWPWPSFRFYYLQDSSLLRMDRVD